MARTVRLDAPAGFELWLADLCAEPSARDFDDLSIEERERAARFVFDRDRRRFVAARLALRELLGARTGLAASALEFVQGRYGKPRLAASLGWAFNLSHSADLAVIALARGAEIGVDLEVLRAVDDVPDLAARHFTAAEFEELAGTPRADRDRAFLRCWTRKEACLKAIGSGLSVAPESFEAGLRPGLTVVQIATTEVVAAVEVQSVESCQRLVAALAKVVPT